MIRFAATAPVSPAASANGTVRPSDMPITTSRTVSLAVKWCSTWGFGIAAILVDRVSAARARARPGAPISARRRAASTAMRATGNHSVFQSRGA